MKTLHVTQSPGQAASGFTLCELIATMGLLVLLFGCVYSALHQLYRLQTRYRAETGAMLILANTVERLATEPRPSPGDVREVFADECARSTFVRQGQLVPRLQAESGRLMAQLNGPDGHQVVGIVIGK